MNLWQTFYYMVHDEIVIDDQNRQTSWLRWRSVIYFIYSSTQEVGPLFSSITHWVWSVVMWLMRKRRRATVFYPWHMVEWKQRLLKTTQTRVQHLRRLSLFPKIRIGFFAFWLPACPVGGGSVYSEFSQLVGGGASCASACAAAAALQRAGNVSGPHEELIRLSPLFSPARLSVVTTLLQSFN